MIQENLVTFSVEWISVLVVTRCELYEYIGVAVHGLGEGQLRYGTPDPERVHQRPPHLYNRKIRCIVDDSEAQMGKVLILHVRYTV